MKMLDIRKFIVNLYSILGLSILYIFMINKIWRKPENFRNAIIKYIIKKFVRNVKNWLVIVASENEIYKILLFL